MVHCSLATHENRSQRGGGQRVITIGALVMVLFTGSAPRAVTGMAQNRTSESISTPGHAAALPCGPTCMAVLCAYYDRPIDADRLDCLVDPEGRTSLSMLQKYALDLGLQAQAVRLTPEELCSLDTPAVLHIRRHGSLDGSASGCFVLFLGMLDADTAVAFDPMAPDLMWGPTRYDALIKSWAGHALLVSDPIRSGSPGGHTGSVEPVVAADHQASLLWWYVGPALPLLLSGLASCTRRSRHERRLKRVSA